MAEAIQAMQLHQQKLFINLANHVEAQIGKAKKDIQVAQQEASTVAATTNI